jgi:DNA-directed RNA polymerase specialized sigma24 family protein
MVAVSSSLVSPLADRDPSARATARRDAITALRVAEVVAAYAAAQIADGLAPREAQQAAADAAAELETAAAVLRRLSRPVGVEAAERRREAARLAGLGLGYREIAVRLGVSPSTAGAYLAGRPT